MLTMVMPLSLRRAICIGMLASALSIASPSGNQITAWVDKPGTKISPTFYGLMTEEINHAYDGGLYGELICNRSFRDSRTSPVYWSPLTNGRGAGAIALDEDAAGTWPTNVSLRLDVSSADKDGRFAIANGGYWGIPVQPHTTYRASFYARSSANFSGPLTVSIEPLSGSKAVASATCPNLSATWKKYTVTLRTGDLKPSTDNRFTISASHSGTVLVSRCLAFPTDIQSSRQWQSY